MFEPDGRNDIQYTGHVLAKAVHIALITLGVIFFTPAVIYVYLRESFHVQEATTWAVAENAPVTALELDYSRSTFTPLDVLLADRAAIEHTVPVPPSLPFTFKVDLIYKDPDFGKITPEWVERHLSISPGIRPVGLDFNNAPIPGALEGPQGGAMATTRLWDWGEGPFGIIRAKCVPNRIAYVGASRAVARMKMFVAVRKMGWDFGDAFTASNHLDARNLMSSPARAASLAYRWNNPGANPKRVMPMETALRFVCVYDRTFAGKLPIVVLHLQPLGDYELNGAHYLDSGLKPGSSYRSEWLGGAGNHSGPFITGMTLGPGTIPSKGRPEFSYLDYLVRSAPCINADTQKAEDALNKMTTFKFWKPLLIAEGITSDQDLQAARDTLAVLSGEITWEIHTIKMKLRSLEHVRL